MTAEETIAPGTVLSGKYEVGRELGRGGMAAIYEATNRAIGKRVAIKLLAGELVKTAGMTERLLREAQAVAAARSPHICDVYDAGTTEGGVPYLVLELLEGEVLFDRLGRTPVLSVELTLGIVLQICRGLARAHEADIVHRDLKPENIFLTRDDDGRLLVKILDFGLAKFYEPLRATDEGVAPEGRRKRLTRDGALFGTPTYMSPEQVRARGDVDWRTDLWAVACLTFECVTGEPVWPVEDGVGETLAKVASAPLPDPRAVRPELPAAFTAWFHKALAREPNERYQNAEQLATALVRSFDIEAEAGALDSSVIQQLLDAAPESALETGAPNGTTPNRPRGVRFSRRAVSLSPNGTTVDQSAAKPSAPTPPAARPRSHLWPIATLVVAIAATAGWVVAGRFADDGAGSAPSSAPAANSNARIGRTSVEQPPPPPVPEPAPWLKTVADAQALVAKGALDDALAEFRRAYEQSRQGLAHNLMEQVQVALIAKGAGAPCQVTGLGRPRLQDLVDENHARTPAGPPSVVWAPGGALVSWTEPRDAATRAFVAALDESLRNRRVPVEISPEATAARTPGLLHTTDRVLGSYAEAGGAGAGYFLRWLGPDGVIAAAPVAVSTRGGIRYTGSTARSSDRGFVAAWAELTEPIGVELFVRRYDAELAPLGGPIRLVDYVPHPTKRRAVRTIAVASTPGRLHVVYSYAQEPLGQIRYQAIDETTAPPGIEPAKPSGKVADRALGKELIVSPRNARAIDPTLACTRDGCYIAWHQPQGGGGVALMDPKTGEPRWHRTLSPRATHPAVGVSPEGDARLAWVEGGRLATASLGVDGVGPASRIARVIGEQPPPAVAAGAERGEWYLTWLDFEAGQQEPYVARVRCR